MRRRNLFTLAALIALFCTGCARDAFRLTEDSAIERLMATKRVASLERAIPNRRMVCMVDDTRPDAVYLYLGYDEGDHTTRVGFYRVTSDGRVWVNQDETGLDDRWVVVE